MRAHVCEHMCASICVRAYVHEHICASICKPRSGGNGVLKTAPRHCEQEQRGEARGGEVACSASATASARAAGWEAAGLLLRPGAAAFSGERVEVAEVKDDVTALLPEARADPRAAASRARLPSPPYRLSAAMQPHRPHHPRPCCSEQPPGYRRRIMPRWSAESHHPEQYGSGAVAAKQRRTWLGCPAWLRGGPVCIGSVPGRGQGRGGGRRTAAWHPPTPQPAQPPPGARRATGPASAACRPGRPRGL